jgi:hypothetical protein
MLLQDATGVEPPTLVPNGVTLASVDTEMVGAGVLVAVFVGAAIAVCVNPPEKVATAMV